jgi:hypothetical protein
MCRPALLRALAAATVISAACYDAPTFPTDPLASSIGGPFFVDTVSAPQIERCLPHGRATESPALSSASSQASRSVLLRIPVIGLCGLDEPAHVGPIAASALPGCDCIDP